MPFKPGESGNPTGEWAGRPFRDALRRALARAKEKDDYRQLNALADKLLDKAAEGDMAAIKELADRIDGKVPQALVGDSEHPPVIPVTRDQAKQMAEAMLESSKPAGVRTP